MELWTEKYKPKTVKEIVGQNAAVMEIAGWLNSWKPGKALLLTGPPGSGKNVIAELMAKERGWLLNQINASDERNSEAIERNLYEASKNLPLFHKSKIILIDEADGMSSGDRGGIQAVVKIIKDSRFPVMLTSNEAYNPKLQPLRSYCKVVKLSKIDYRSIERRLREICEKEEIAIEGDVLKNLARWSSGDLRSAITDLQMMSEGKKEIKAEDLESLGFRERETNIFSVLPTVFRSKNINAARKAIQGCDKDPDEIFWWIENNVYQEFADPESLANAFEILSKADLFRQKVAEQQNWRFRMHMIDMLAGISLAGESSHAYIQYRPPDRFIALARLRGRKAEMGQIYAKLSSYTHSPEKIVKNYYLPYLRMILSNKKDSDNSGVELSKEEIGLIVSG